MPEIGIRMGSEKGGRNDGAISENPDTQLHLLTSTTAKKGL